MSGASPQNKSGSGRRRTNRQGVKMSGNKAYLSESDMPGAPLLGNNDLVLPQTPQKSASGSPAPYHLANSSRPKSNKIRPNNVTVSPDNNQFDRQTTPPTISGVKSASMPAFAGSTFHNSPAPSALPMPSFMAKLNTGSPRPGDEVQTGHVRSPSASIVEHPTPQRPLSGTAARESPLEAIFRADRAEKERARRTSSANSLGRAMGPCSLPTERSLESSELSILSAGKKLQPSQRPGGISTPELNGAPGRPFGPAFSTPYHERIRASRDNSTTASSPRNSPQTGSNEDKAEALKRVLWGVGAVPLNSSLPKPSVPLAQQTAATSDSSSLEGQRPTDVAAMEDHLRRILNIRS